MNIKRLEKLADFLENDPIVNKRGKFHLATWAASYSAMNGATDEGDPLNPILMKLAKKNEGKVFVDKKGQPLHCRTAACAVGWGTRIPSFRRAGLRLNWDDEVCEFNLTYTDKKTGEEFKHFAACEEFFDMYYDNVLYLFSPDSYPTKDQSKPKVVAKRIRSYIKRIQKESLVVA
jgi:hypothetical protein